MHKDMEHIKHKDTLIPMIGFGTWTIAGTETIAAVFSEGTFWVVFVQTPEEEDTVVWNVEQNRWETTDTESLKEVIDGYNSEYCIRIDGGTITELGY